MMVQLLAIIVTLSTVVYSWPDGAPCKRAVVESMNPLQAEEHAGGLQLTDPPYRIDVDSKCYWRNQAVTCTILLITLTIKFQESGKLVRLDDNGSWRQQCFRYQDSVTNAHDEDKNEVRLWWKNDKDDDYIVQFVATVVKSQYVFWVKSVLSPPLPPCRLQRKFEGYVPPPVTAPPQTIPFKLVN
ncbi:unnamed protein product [Toxocara canis]|uniref:Reelin domain-containing protein n=1 Tax=Toxocara canis TaxID=6265 RepID=A0A183V1U7_TOXCA|nr:unnamed protein product [Toxocara canis]